MKRIFVSLMLLGLAVAPVMAQSSMTDNQVAEFVQKEVARGTSQAQIVTKLMQNGETSRRYDACARNTSAR